MNRTGVIPIVVAALLAVVLQPPRLDAQSAGGVTSDEELVAAALEASEEVRLAGIATQQSQVQLDQARARRGPQVSGSLDFSYISNPVDPIILRAGEFGTYPIGGVDTLMPPQDIRVYDGMESTLFRLSGVLEQPIFTWGKLDLGVALAEHSVELSGLQAEQKRFDIELQVRTVAAAIRHLAVMEEIAEEQTALSADLVDLVDSLLDAGVGVRTDLLEAQVGSRQAELAEREIVNQLEVQLVTLRRLTGRPELGAGELGSPRFGPDDTTEVSDLALPSTEDLVAAARAGNPGLAALAQAQVTAAARTELARASQSRRPDFGLRLELSFTGPRIPLEPDWYGQDEFNLTASIGLQSTLYDGGLLAGDTTLASLDESSLVEQYSTAGDTLEDEIRQAVLATELARARINYLAANDELLQEKQATRQREFDAGVGSRDGIVRAELAVLANRLEIEQELTTLESRTVALTVLCGMEL